jgi:hypothetical protein
MLIPSKSHVAVQMPMACLLLIITGICIFMFAFAPVHPDEAEHLHISWLISSGEQPYVDFYQPHFPVLWFLSVPIIKTAPLNISVLYIFRLLCITAYALSAVVGLIILKQIYPVLNKTAVLMYLTLVTGGGIVTEVFRFRPDPFMSLCVIYGIFLSMKVSGNRVLHAFGTGIAFGAAFILSPKMICLFLLLPIQLVICHFRDKQVRVKKTLLVYLGGVFSGVSPLLFYCFFSSVGKGCIDCVFGSYVKWIANPDFEWKFVTGTKIVFTVMVVVAVLAIIRVIINFLKKRSPKALTALILSIQILLCVTPAIFNYNHAEYNLMTAVLPFSVFAAYILSKNIFKNFPKRTAVAVLFVQAIAVGVSLISVLIDFKRTEQVKALDINKLISVSNKHNLSHALFLPFHPVFSKNITEDYFFIYMNKCNTAKLAEAIIKQKPDLVFAERYWDIWRDDGFIDVRTQWKIQAFLEEEYSVFKIGSQEMLILKSKAALIEQDRG